MLNAQQSEDFWQDQDNAQKVNSKIVYINETLSQILNIEQNIILLQEFEDEIKKNNNQNLINEFNKELVNLQLIINKIYMQTLLNRKYDKFDAIVSIHSGAGGTESNDWVQMLFRAYSMFCEKNKFKIEILDAQDGDLCGYKTISFKVLGANAYGYLSCEKGVHRLVRISPFDSAKRRHTTFASVEVMPVLDKNSTEIILNDKDLRIDTYRSSGAGGQNINKTDSAVRITYLPLNIVVSCQTQRSQMQNKETCFEMLKARLLEIKEQEEQKNINNIRGELKNIEWGSQIRSYIFCPYTLVKDHRTNFETTDVSSVMDGNFGDFILEYLKKR